MKHLDFTILDLAMLFLAYFISIFIRFDLPLNEVRRSMVFQQGLALLLIYFCVAMFTSSYKNIIRRTRYQEMRSVFVQVFSTFAIFVIYLYFTHAMDFSRLITFYTALISGCLIYTARIIWKRIMRLHMLNNEHLPHLIIIADENTAKHTIRAMKKRRYNMFFIAGVIVTDKSMKGKTLEKVPVVCNVEEIKQYVLDEVVDEIFIRVPNQRQQQDLIRYFLEVGLTVHVGLVDSADELPHTMVEKFGGVLVLTTSNNVSAAWKLAIKRFMDILGGLIGTAITGVLFLFIAPRIKKADPGPVFFRQTRVGKNGRHFKILKFRSMYLDAEERKKELMKENEMDGLMFKMKDDPRVLPGIGEKIRRSSLDEFPQFINVLKGDMSLVGTRPPTEEEFRHYDAHHKMRLSFKPGITGMWQVSGRSNIRDFEEIVRLDSEYIRNWSLWLDVKILFKTVGVVLRKEGSE